MPAATDPESRWFTIYVHTCDADPRGSGERPTDGKQYVGQAVHEIRDVERGFTDRAERAMRTRWRHKIRETSVLGHAVRKFGPTNFRHEVVAVVLGQAAANLAEDEWITKLDCLEPRGYNRKRGGQAPLTFEERSEFCKRGWAKIPVEQRRESALERIAATPPEELSRRVYQRAKTMGSERLSAAISKGHVTRGAEGQAVATAKRIENTDFAAASQKRENTLGPDGRSARACQRAKNMGAKKLSSAARSGYKTKWLRSFALAMNACDYRRAAKILSTSFAAMVRWSTELSSENPISAE